MSSKFFCSVKRIFHDSPIIKCFSSFKNLKIGFTQKVLSEETLIKVFKLSDLVYRSMKKYMISCFTLFAEITTSVD